MSLKIHILRTSVTLPLPLDRTFNFFADAANLESITPPELYFRIITPQPIEIKKDAIIHYQLRLFGIPFRWKTRITKWYPPYMFIDEQIHGPYKFWVHTHSFYKDNGFTSISDEVQYILPFWPIGEIAFPFVYVMLKRIFSYRKKKIRKILLNCHNSNI